MSEAPDWRQTATNDNDGYMTPNQDDADCINSVTATPNSDGSFTISFGGDPSLPNHLPVVDGWNYIARLYRPSSPITEGTWQFPTPSPA